MESEWEMRDAARSGSKRWALGNWDLRWKVTAVLAVPLAVAVGLGVSRITSEFSEANRLSEISEQVDALPAVTSLSAVSARVAGGQMVQVGPMTMVTDQDLADLDGAIAAAEAKLGSLSPHPESHARGVRLPTREGRHPGSARASSDASDRDPRET